MIIYKICKIIKKIKRKVNFRMKKLFRGLLSLVLALSFSVPAFAKTENNNVSYYENGGAVELQEGKTVRIALQSQNTQIPGIANVSSVDPIDQVGFIDLKKLGNSITYNIVITKVIYTSILCSAEITDNTSGLTRSITTIYTNSGSIPFTPLSGHRFSISVNGFAYMLDKPCVSIYGYGYWIN